MSDGGRHLISQRSGFRIRSEDSVRDPYAKIWVHKDEVDERNPQEFVRGRRERPKKARSPEPPDRFLTTNQVTRDSL